MAEPGAEPSEVISVEDDNDSSVTRERQVVSTLIHLSAFCLIKVLSSVQNVFAVFFSRESYGFIKK